MEQIRRAYVLRHMIGQLENVGQERNATSYLLAKYIGTTPQTVTNTLLRCGQGIGITYHEKQHRPGVTKRVWFVSNPDNVYENTRALLEYKRWMRESWGINL